jgi:hypothetical protein
VSTEIRDLGTIYVAHDLFMERTDLPMRSPRLPAGVTVLHDDNRDGGALILRNALTGQLTRFVYVGLDAIDRPIPVLYEHATPAQQAQYLQAIERRVFGERRQGWWRRRGNCASSRVARVAEAAPLDILPGTVQEYLG